MVVRRPNCRGAWPLLVLAALAPVSSASGPARPAGAYAVPPRLADVLEPAPLASVRLTGPAPLLAHRIDANTLQRLARVDPGPLLAGFRRRPGSHPWIGEHVGKWLHAATLAWAHTGDAGIRTRLDEVARELIKTQEADGYLGTYVLGQRFGLYRGADWDVWVHKYNLIGLLTYYRYTGNPEALAACRRVGDLLDRTFGPGKKSLISAGTHVGMAATSVLEPMVLLYRHTGEERYLAFARSIVDCWDEPNGPRVLRTLVTEKSVPKTANGKAYEMLSNLVGLCELARATGDRSYLEPCLNAWKDITSRHLYVTGSASSHELFHEDAALPNRQSANVGETCVTVTWIQLNAQLLRLTGEARFGEELERSFYNHLAAAQRPDGAEWCYYTSLEGAKPYGPGINCCVSSGPRGMALAPELAFLTSASERALCVNLWETGRAELEIGGPVTVETVSGLPALGRLDVTLRLPEPREFGVRVRVPHWLRAPQTEVAPALRGTIQEGWLTLPVRRWRDGDRFRLQGRLGAEAVAGGAVNQERMALRWGPWILALDSARNPGLPPPGALGLAGDERAPAFSPLQKPGESLAFQTSVRAADGRPRPAVLVPFSEAGATGGRYRVWLPSPGAKLAANASLFGFHAESRSRSGNVDGSIADGDPATYVVTFNNRPAEEDWYAVVRDSPARVRRIVFAHGHCFHDGGWFDASRGRPRVEVQRAREGSWEEIGELAGYPATTTSDSRGLRDGQSFTFELATPLDVYGIRVVGRPASGDNPQQAFSSCAELQGWP